MAESTNNSKSKALPPVCDVIQSVDKAMTSYSDMISVCNARHLLNCPCHDDVIKQAFDKHWPDEMKRIDVEGHSDDAVVISSRKQALLKSIRESFGERFVEQDKRCPLEQQRLKDSLSLFVNSQYDLSNPVIHGIVRKALEQDLLSFRMNLRVSRDDLLLWRETSSGGEWVVNPLVSANQRASDSIIRALETISKIVDGTLSKNVNFEVDEDNIIDRLNVYRDNVDFNRVSDFNSKDFSRKSSS